MDSSEDSEAASHISADNDAPRAFNVRVLIHRITHRPGPPFVCRAYGMDSTCCPVRIYDITAQQYSRLTAGTATTNLTSSPYLPTAPCSAGNSYTATAISAATDWPRTRRFTDNTRLLQVTESTSFTACPPVEGNPRYKVLYISKPPCPYLWDSISGSCWVWRPRSFAQNHGGFFRRNRFTVQGTSFTQLRMPHSRYSAIHCIVMQAHIHEDMLNIDDIHASLRRTRPHLYALRNLTVSPCCALSRLLQQQHTQMHNVLRDCRKLIL